MRLIFVFISIFILAPSAPVDVYTYIHDVNGELTIDSVREQTFNTTTKNNLGIDNGNYWFRIDNGLIDRSILELKNSHAQNLALYDSIGQQIPLMSDTGYPSFFLINRKITYPLYLNANFSLEAYFPISVSTEREFAKNDKLSLLVSGLFYGTALALFMATFIFSMIFRKKQFLFFSILVFTVALSITGEDSILGFFGVPIRAIQILESLGHLFLGLLIAGFTLSINKFDKKKIYLRNGFIILSVISVICWLVYSVTANVWAFALVDISAMLIVLLLGFFIHKIGNINLRLAITIFYILDSILLLNGSILHLLGIEFIETTLIVISIITILNFTFIAVYLLISLKNIQVHRVKNQQKIKKYVAQIKELDSYKDIQDADDDYMESLIYNFKLENIEIKVLSEISKNRNKDYIAEKYGLTDERLQGITNSLFDKLGINATQDFPQLTI